MDFLPSLVELQAAIPVIISLIIIEGLLSVDNALAIAAMASHLPDKQKQLALKLGIFGAYAFRGLALACAGYIIDNPWLKIAGAAYLIYLMAQHFAEKSEEQEQESEGVAASHVGRGLVATIVSIELLDLSLSVDNVVAAVALSDKLWVVCTGVFIGILALRFVAGACIKLIERFPILEAASFILIGYIGFILLAEMLMHVDIGPIGKFAGIAIILLHAILFSEFEAFRVVVRPFNSAVLPLMKVFNAVVGGFFTILFWPLKRAWTAIRPKPIA